MDLKRPGEELAIVPVSKRARSEIANVNKGTSIVQNDISRTSNLMAPIMLLEGHQGEIFTVEFHPEGQYLASAGFDRQIYIWNVYWECENISLMAGHTGAIMELHFSTDGNTLFTASNDSTLGMWDIETKIRLRKLKGQTNFVNSCPPARRGPQLVCSGSDDCPIKLWDP